MGMFLLDDILGRSQSLDDANAVGTCKNRGLRDPDE
jgi:hypothetical protein